MRPFHILAAAALALVVGTACATPATAPVHAGDELHARCPCCVAYGDLACIDVTVEPDTPSATHDGVTYWFCSDECRADFLADPEHFCGE